CVRTKVQSIRQNDLPDALPDFRNLGVISRILLSVNALALLFALARSREIGEFAAKVTEIAGSLEPILLIVVIVLYAGSALLERLAYVQDRKSTRLNSSHVSISYAVFCL